MFESKLPNLGVSIFSQMSGLANEFSAINLSQGFPEFDAPDLLKTQLNYYVQHIKRGLTLEGITGQSLPTPFYQTALTSEYGLTTAESSLVMALLQQESLVQAATSLGRSYNTSKTQLASIFKKTQTHSQMGLMKRLLAK